MGDGRLGGSPRRRTIPRLCSCPSRSTGVRSLGTAAEFSLSRWGSVGTTTTDCPVTDTAELLVGVGESGSDFGDIDSTPAAAGAKAKSTAAEGGDGASREWTTESILPTLSSRLAGAASTAGFGVTIQAAVPHVVAQESTITEGPACCEPLTASTTSFSRPMHGAVLSLSARAPPSAGEPRPHPCSPCAKTVEGSVPRCSALSCANAVIGWLREVSSPRIFQRAGASLHRQDKSVKWTPRTPKPDKYTNSLASSVPAWREL